MFVEGDRMSNVQVGKGTVKDGEVALSICCMVDGRVKTVLETTILQYRERNTPQFSP